MTRGRIALAEAYFSGKIGATDKLSDMISSCMKCRQCETACPSGVRFAPALIETKSRIKRERGEGALERGFFETVALKRRAFDAAVAAAAAASRLLKKDAGAKLRHLPLLFNGKRRLPEIAWKSALKAFPEIIPAEGRKIGRAALFLGCLGNYVYVNAAASAVKVLSAAGFEVVVPKKQLCCGLAATTLGEIKTARKFADANSRAFGKFAPDFIVPFCASCTGMLSSGYDEFLDISRPFNARVLDFVQMLEIIEKESPLFGRINKMDILTTYHDPCHHTHLKIRGIPRRWLKAAANFREMPDANRCCGGGGSFSLFYYPLALKIGAEKVASIRSVNPDAVVTACPGCMMQLEDLLGGAPPVLHISELISKSLNITINCSNRKNSALLKK
jgi:glycolate oxidase iron-sulfur subunit